MQQCVRQHRPVLAARTVRVGCPSLPRLQATSCHRISALRQRCPPSALLLIPCRGAHQNRFISIQIAASWGNGATGGGAAAGAGDAAYADPTRLGAFSSGGGGSIGSGGSSSTGSDSDSPIAGLLSAVVANVRAAPLLGAAAPWVAALMLPVVLWCTTWVFSAGMFTLAQTSLAAMSGVAQLLHPVLPMRGVSYEDVAVSLVKALQGGTDSAATWSRPGLLLPSWLVRWLMASLYGLAAASTSIAGSLVNNMQLLAVLVLSKGLLYANCLLFMLPLGSGFSSLATTIAQRLSGSSGGEQQQRAPAAAFGGSSSEAAGVSSSSGSSGGSGGFGLPFKLPSLDDTTALALKLAGVLPWVCISAAAVLQPALLSIHSTAPSSSSSNVLHLAIAAPQVAVCCAMLVLMLTSAVAAGRFAWDLGRRQGDADAVTEFGCVVGVLAGLQAALNAAQLGLALAGQQLQPQQLGIPLLSTLILGRVAWSTWRLWRLEAAAPSLWLQVLAVAPGPRGTKPAAGGSGGGGSGGGSSNSWRREP